MEIKLGFAGGNREILSELLQARGLTVSENSAVSFIPRGETIPDKGISIVYDPADIDGLVALLDSFRELSTESSRLHVVGRKGDRFTIQSVTKILYFEADGNYIYCRTAESRYEVNKKLYELEKEFASSHFIRINKSCVVNIRWIEEIWPWFSGRLMLKFRETGEKVEVSRKYVKSFKETLDM